MSDSKLLQNLLNKVEPGDVIYVPMDEAGKETYYFMLEKNYDTFVLGRSKKLSESGPVFIAGCGQLRLGEDGKIYCEHGSVMKNTTKNFLQVARMEKINGAIKKGAGKSALERYLHRTPDKKKQMTNEKFVEIQKKHIALIHEIVEITADERIKTRSDTAGFYLEVLGNVQDAEERKVILSVIIDRANPIPDGIEIGIGMPGLDGMPGPDLSELLLLKSIMDSRI